MKKKIRSFMPKTEYIVQQMLSGRNMCKELVKRYFEDSGMYLIFLFSDNIDVNYYTTYYLPILRQEKKVSKFIIVSPNSEVKRLVEEIAVVPYTFVLCSQENKEDISVYFFSRMGDKLERAIINASCCPSENSVFELVGNHNVTIKEIVAFAVFGFKEIPSQEDVENAARQHFPIYRGIDWSAFDDEHKCVFDNNSKIEDMVLPYIDELIQRGEITKKDQLIIFSVTKVSGVIINKLREYNVVAVLDNNKDLSGTRHEGIGVYTPYAFLKDKKPDDYKIIVPTRSYKIICEQLDELGYHLNQHVLVTYRSNVLGLAQSIGNNMEIGEQAYESIRESYQNLQIYLAPYPGTGDMYLIGMYLRERMAHDKVSECVLVVCSSTCKRIIQLFDLDDVVKDIIVINDVKKCENLVYFAKCYGLEKTNITVLNDGYEMLQIHLFRGFQGLDFNTLFQRVVFYAPNRITYYDIRKESADSIFEMYELTKGKTILFSPHANTIAKMSEEIWVELAKQLISQGYDVCTNVFGEEKAIEGTIGLFLPYSQIVDFLDKAGGFIAFRSGLCDIVSGTTAKKVILYPPEKIFCNTTNYDYFSLEKMGLCTTDIKEIVVENDEQSVIKDITNFIRG